MIEDLAEAVRTKSRPDSRATPLKSLLKKPSFEITENSDNDTDSDDDDDGKISPKKVHFSEIDQVNIH